MHFKVFFGKFMEFVERFFFFLGQVKFDVQVTIDIDMNDCSYIKIFSWF